MRRSFNLDTEQQIQFGRYLKSLREKAHKTQAVVAEETGVSIGYVSTLESGMRNPPSHDKLVRFAQAFGVPLDELEAAAGYFNEDKLGGLDKDRIEWAFEAACRDPYFKFGKNIIYKSLSLETKAFIVELYELATSRQLLTPPEATSLKSEGH